MTLTVRSRMEHGSVRRCRRERIDHRRQWSIADFDEIERVLGTIAVGRDHDGDRLADITHAIGRYRPTFDAGLYAHDQARRQRFDIGTGDDREDSIRGFRRGAIDRLDVRVRVRRPQDRRLERAGRYAEIVEIVAAAGQQRRIFKSRYGAADPILCALRELQIVAVHNHRSSHSPGGKPDRSSTLISRVSARARRGDHRTASEWLAILTGPGLAVRTRGSGVWAPVLAALEALGRVPVGTGGDLTVPLLSDRVAALAGAEVRRRGLRL